MLRGIGEGAGEETRSGAKQTRGQERAGQDQKAQEGAAI
jgi:hypothetical protein